jgi:hypothetical protein
VYLESNKKKKREIMIKKLVVGLMLAVLVTLSMGTTRFAAVPLVVTWAGAMNDGVIGVSASVCTNYEQPEVATAGTSLNRSPNIRL